MNRPRRPLVPPILEGAPLPWRDADEHRAAAAAVQEVVARIVARRAAGPGDDDRVGDALRDQAVDALRGLADWHLAQARLHEAAEASGS